MRRCLTAAAVLAAGALALQPARAQQPAPAGAAPNPLLSEWVTPFGVPPFDRIRPEHFLPAYREAIARHTADVEAVARNVEPPTFANTIEALDASGELLNRVSLVFGNLSSAATSDSLQAVARLVTPLVTSHQDDVVLNDSLFQRVKAVWEARGTLGLAPDQAMLLERTWKRFVRGGALLSKEGKERLRALNTELAALTLKFGDDLLQETNAYRLVLDTPADLAGLPELVVAGAAEAAKKAGLEGKWLFRLQEPGLSPFLMYAENRDLRRRMFTAYITRCDRGNDADNKKVLSRIAAVRARRAQLLGYRTHADYVLDDCMARTPGKVYALLDRLWPAARTVAGKEAQALQAAARAEGKVIQIEPWDWFYYREKVRQARYAIDDQALRAYFPLDQVREGVFHVAHRLYGITFAPLTGVPVYDPDVKAYEVKDADGSHLAVFYCDYHPRPGKRVGAWSGRYRDTWVRNGTSVRPVVVNVCSFPRPAGEAPSLLSLEETRTLFHEFGHALHSILSKVRYRSLAQVPRDFVELPSQVMENWALEPEVLKVYARHWKTGAVIPDSLVDRIRASRKFDQGFATVEYLAASLLDMDWHTRADTGEADATAFENATLARIGMPRDIVPRYRSPYFQHIFGGGGGYSAGYYAYVWAEVLDADAFEAFKEKGLFDPATARSFRVNVLERGGSEEAMTLYTRFRGREPSIEPLLERRGLNSTN